MKKLLFFLLCLILVGCANNKDYVSSLDEVFSSAEKPMIIRANNYGNYYDYYIPSDTSEFNSGPLYSLLEYDNSRFLMDVNIAGIVSQRYYPDNTLAEEGFFDDSKQVYEKRGVYVNSEDDTLDYIYKLFQYEDCYLACLRSRDLIFYAYISEDDIVPVTSRMLLMAKGVHVKEEEVIADYSLKDVIDYEKKQVNLFETIMPVNGNINDFMVDKKDEQSTE